MSIQAGANPNDMLQPEAVSPVVGSRSFGMQLLADTFRRSQAWFAAGWIFIVIFAAIMAPLIANSNPILLKVDNRWSSPLIAHLSWADVTLFVFAAAVIVMLLVR